MTASFIVITTDTHRKSNTFKHKHDYSFTQSFGVPANRNMHGSLGKEMNLATVYSTTTGDEGLFHHST